MTTVIVQPDSIAPWVGLIGVVAGAVLGVMSSLVQTHFGEARKRHDQLRNATNDLRAGADGLFMLVQAYRNGGGSQTLIEWIPLIMAQYERVQSANEAIIRLGRKELAKSAQQLSEIALKCTSPEGSNLESLTDAINAFTGEVRSSEAAGARDGLRRRGGLRRHGARGLRGALLPWTR